MATITTRSGKGSALTHTEMDNNLTNLNSAKIEADTANTLTNKTINTADNTITVVEADISDLQSYLTAETNDLTSAVTWANVPDANITQSSVTQHQAALSVTESQISDLGSYLSTTGGTMTGAIAMGTSKITGVGDPTVAQDAATKAYVDANAGGDVVDDPSPQLGADLDVNGNSILDGLGTEVKFADNIRLRGTRYVFFEEGTTGNGIKLQAPTGTASAVTFTLPAADGTTGQILKTDGSGNLSFTDDAGGIALTDISVGAEGTPAGDGALAYDNTTGVFTYTPPVDITGNSATATALATARNIAGQSFDGTANITIGINDLSDVDTTGILNDKILKYNSTSGNWEIADDSTGAGGLASLVDDPSPQLGGPLDVNGNSIVSTSNASITLAPDGTGDVVLGTMTFDADQSITASEDNYVLTYDNATGKISLEAAAAGGIADVVEDTTPQLGGNLDMNGNNIYHDTGSARGTVNVIGSTGTGYSATHGVGPVIFKQNDAFDASSRVYLYNHYSVITMNNENTTVTGANARFRGNYDNLSLDVNGCNYGVDTGGRGIIANTPVFSLHNDNNTYEADLPKVAHTENLFWNAIGYDANYNNSVGDNADINVGKAYMVTNQFRDDTRGAQTGRVHITTESAMYHTSSQCIDATSNIVWDSGAKAYNVKNDQPQYLEKFGSVEQYSEHAYEATHSASGTFTVDYNNGNTQYITLSDNITSFTMSNFPGTNNITGNNMIGSVTLFLQQDGTGGRTISFTAGAGETFKIANGITTADTGANNFTVAHVMKVGSTYLWTISGNYT